MTRIDGYPELIAKLRALKNVAVGETLQDALVASALPIQNEAKQKAPYRSGTLSRGITIERIAAKKTYAKVAISTSKVPYARIQEFGGVIVQTTKKGNKRMIRIVAQPYLRPAFDTKKDEARSEFIEALRDLIQAAVQ